MVSSKKTTKSKEKIETLQSQIHAGRRRKLRERFMRDGLRTFSESEVIEFALGFAIPRIDTNPAAHALLNRFGSLATIIDTNPANLKEVYGIGESAAVFLNFLHQFITYVSKQQLQYVKITTPLEAINYLRPLMKTYSVEEFVIICLDQTGNVKTVNSVTNNELNMVHVNVREIITMVTANKASQVLISHNHLTGNAEPSVPDMLLTKRLLLMFDNLGINLIDHIIFAADKDFSFTCNGVMNKLREEIGHR